MYILLLVEKYTLTTYPVMGQLVTNAHAVVDHL